MKHFSSNIIALALTLGLSPFAAGQVKLHPELEAAAAKVDTAGSFFEVDFFKEEIDMMMPYAEILGEMLTELTEGETPMDFPGLLESSGMLDHTAMARSNTRHGASWINKTYLANGGSRKGLFSLHAADRQEFRVARMAPLNTDIALEVRADLTQLPALIKSIGGALGVSSEASEQLDKEVKNLGMTVGEALGRSAFTLQLAMVFDSGAAGAETELPEPKEILACIDGMNWFWNQAGEAWLEEGRSAKILDFTRSEKDGVITYTITSEGNTKPGVPAVIVVAADTLWLSSSAEFLEKSREGATPLADDKEFQEAWSGLPDAGNAMAYVSPRLFGAFIGSVLPMIGVTEESGEASNATDRLLSKIAKDLITAKSGLAFSLSPDENGLLTVSKLPIPGKYLDDLLAGDMLFDLLADPSLLEAAADIDSLPEDGAVPLLSDAEVDAAIEEAVAETRATLQKSGLDEATINGILETTREETRKEMRRFLKSGGKEESKEK